MKTTLMAFAFVVVLLPLSLAESDGLAGYSLTSISRSIRTTILLSKDEPLPKQSSWATEPLFGRGTNVIREGMVIGDSVVTHVDKINRSYELERDGKRVATINGVSQGAVTNYTVVVSSNGHSWSLMVGQRLVGDWVLAAVSSSAVTFTNKMGNSQTLTVGPTK